MHHGKSHKTGWKQLLNQSSELTLAWPTRLFQQLQLWKGRVCLGLHIIVMIAGIHISQETFAIDMLTALKPSLEHDRKHILGLSRLYLDGDQA